MKKLKTFEGFFTNYFNLIKEDISTTTFQVVPNGSTIPKSGIVKIGIDPTSDKLHLGHLIPIKKVKELKDNGMSVHVILGTFTAQMGDPSGKNEMRPILSESTTKANADSIISQLHRVLGEDITIHYNHEWFNEYKLPYVMKMLSKYTVDYLMSRDAFQKRKESGSNIGMHELIVPLLQGLDSVEIKADVEVGGTDQLFNFLLSRDVQEKMGQKPEICLMSPIINGTDGRKMSKSYNNCIYINDSTKDVFGKVMSISDEVMHQWYPLFFDTYDKGEHPMKLKKALATKVTDVIWGDGSGQKELDIFEKSVQNKELPPDILEFENTDISSFVSILTKRSKSDSRRLIQQGAVVVIRGGDEIKVGDIEFKLESGDVVRAGKRNYGIVK